MYTVNKNLCLFKIFHATYLFPQLSCELYVRNWKPVQSLQNITTFSLVCSYFQLPLFWQILDSVVVKIIFDIMIRYNLQVQQFVSNFFYSIMA